MMGGRRLVGSIVANMSRLGEVNQLPCETSGYRGFLLLGVRSQLYGRKDVFKKKGDIYAYYCFLHR